MLYHGCLIGCLFCLSKPRLNLGSYIAFRISIPIRLPGLENLVLEIDRFGTRVLKCQ